MQKLHVIRARAHAKNARAREHNMRRAIYLFYLKKIKRAMIAPKQI